MPCDRRQFLTRLAGPAALTMAGGGPALARTAAGPGTPALPPVSETDWDQLAGQFALDREVVNLNHAGVGCCCQAVLAAVERHARDIERLPSYHIFQYGPKLEPIRRELALMIECDPEEVALVRNATEALDAILLGLPLRRGDEIVTTTLDYWAMLDALDQREKRDGVVVRRVRVPVPAHTEEEILGVFAAALTERTKLILVSHPVNLTGQHFPVARLCALAHKRGIQVAVDAAQSFGQFPLSARALDCDYLGTSLHKWLMGPKGTGLLYVKKDLIPGLWPLFPSGQTRAPDDIRKFELIGTAPPVHLALAEAIRFHRAIGPDRIAARLRHLRDLWSGPLRAHERFQFHTSFEPGMSGVIVTVQLRGVDSGDLFQRLFREERIFTYNVARRTGEFQGLRISPGLATTPSELERFTETMLRLARELPSGA
jgi:selenocysteine lyase/cysteine desulfurase